MFVCARFIFTSKWNRIDGLLNDSVAGKDHAHRKYGIGLCNGDDLLKVVAELKRVLLSTQLATPEPGEVCPLPALATS